MSDNEMSTFSRSCAALAGIAVGGFAATMLWDTLLNARRKKWYLDEYVLSGVDTRGYLEQVTGGESPSETGVTHHVYYRYQYCASDEESCSMATTYYKKQAYRTPLCGQTLRFPRLFTVTVLPGYPKSGIPKLLVDNRDQVFGGCAMIEPTVASLCLLVFGAMILSLVFLGDEYVVSFELGAITVFLILGFPCSRWMFHRWKLELREKTIVEPYESVASAEAIIREPVVTATPLTTADCADVFYAEEHDRFPLLSSDDDRDRVTHHGSGVTATETTNDHHRSSATLPVVTASASPRREIFFSR